MSMHDELMDLYGGGATVEAVEAGAAHQQLSDKYAGIGSFPAERNYVRGLRKRLQDVLVGLRPSIEVRQSLRLLHGLRDEKKRAERDDYHRLIKRAYWPAWSPAQQNHFDESYEVIAQGQYYFLSFTRHNLTPGEVNVVNSNHRHLIGHVFFNKKPHDIGDYEKDNLLAKVIDHSLRSSGMRGFYYPTHEGDNAGVRDKLLANLRTTRAFVQIVCIALFDKAPDANFCYFEYENVRIAISPGRRFFILGNRRNELQHLQLSHGEFEPWHDEIIEIKDALELEYTEFFDDKVLRDNRRAIDEKIVAPLNKLWMSMFDQVPA